MAAKPSKPAAKKAAPKIDDAALALADLAVRYPFRWFPQGVVAKMCGFGDNAMTEFAMLGAPIVAKKSNPHLLHLWLTQNIEKIGKINGDKPDSEDSE